MAKLALAINQLSYNSFTIPTGFASCTLDFNYCVSKSPSDVTVLNVWKFNGSQYTLISSYNS